jgi:hypothetical protein
MLQMRQLVEPVIDQAIALIQRDQQAAIDLVEPGLAPFAAFHKGPGPRDVLPCLTVYASGLPFDPAVEHTFHWLAEITFVADVGEFDQDGALHLCYQYARVLHGILESASGEDWETPLPILLDGVSSLTRPLLEGSGKRSWVHEIRFEQGEPEDRQTSTARVRLDLRFEAEEV